MRALRCVLVVLGLCGPAAATAQAAYEPFDYPLNDNLAGANGGVGFDGPWTVTANGPSSAVTGAQSGVIVAGLSYSDALGQVLPVSGGAWQANSGLAFGQGQRGTVAVPGGAVSSSYGNDGRSRDIGNAAGKTTLMVMRLDFASSASDTMHARLNPVVGQPLSAPQLIGSFRNYASLFSGLSLVWGDQRQFDFDELRASLTSPAGLPTLVVDTTSDDGSVAFQACTSAPGDCSLRGAIAKANLDDAADTLHFAIPGSDPGCDGSGVCRIAPQGVLPTIAKPLTIDGYTQPGASANTIPAPGALDSVLKIEIDGSGVAAAVPAILNIGAAGPTGAAPLVILRGLAIGGVPSNNGTNAVNFGFRSADSRIEGCYLGTDASGNVARSAQFGVLADETVTIGGDTPAARNLVSRNRSDGLRLAGAPRVEGNLIGLRRDGLAELPNSGDGIRITSNCSAPFPSLVGNRIAGNAGRGLFWTGGDICSSDAGGALSGNVFGLAVDGNPLGNAAGAIAIATQGSGVDIGGLAAGQGNTIAQSFGSPGHGIAGLRRFVRARGNAWPGNAGLGLSIGAAAGTRSLNDVGDEDSISTSRQQNWPEISAPSQAGNQLNLSYRVDSEFDAGAAGTAGKSVYPLTVDFYRASGDEGEVFLGSDTYESGDAQQVKAIALTLPAGVSFGPNDVVVATAIDAQGNQSEFNFYRIQSLAILSDDPDPSPAGVPYTVTVRAEAVPGEPFAPNGRVRIVDGRGGECRATLVPTATPLRSEGSCELLSTGAPGAITLTASLPATESAFARVDGTSVANATASHTVTAGIEALELVAGSGQTAAVGDAFALPLQVRALGAGGATIAGVPVQFQAPVGGASASFAQNPVTTGADGIASVVATAITTSGNYNVTARVGALTQTFALTNEPGLDTALAIVSNLPNPSNPGQAVTVTIAVNPEAGGPPPTGSVAVSANTGEACTIVLPAVSCQLLFTIVGERPIQAFYPGDGAYTSSKAAFATQVVQAPPSLRIDAVSANEGDAGTTALDFTVTLQDATGAAVSVDYATANDSAAAPGDYTATSGTLNFSGGTVTQTVTVLVNGDTEVEPDEQFFVNLSNASGASIADGQAIGIVLNDDQPPPPIASIDDVTVQEPVSSGLAEVLARFTVSLDRPAPGPASVRVRTQNGSAQASADFDSNDFVLEFAAGDQSQTVEVYVRDDDIPEGGRELLRRAIGAAGPERRRR
ncbi:MAG: Ig-like domain repeat protein [Rhodanobacteraceae bacterium]|nr:Ig-like domain repeat protein [Rhodanobacteraceae bacterium]